MKISSKFKQMSKLGKLLIIISMLVATSFLGFGTYYLVDRKSTIRVSSLKNEAHSNIWDIEPLCLFADEFEASQQPRGLQYWNYLEDNAQGLFRYARLHGVFTSSDGDRRGKANAGGDVLYTKNNGEIGYNWTIVDNVYDSILDCGITPFIEIGFMPQLISSQPDDNPERRIPADWLKWEHLISNFTNHLIDRYGLEEVLTWRYEVWNEPDAGSFWNDGIEKYCKLYSRTVNVIKSIDRSFLVGGPAIAKDMEEFRYFLQYCDDNNEYLDFISFHSKGSDGEDLYPSHSHLKNRVENFFQIIKEFPQYDQSQGSSMEYHLNEADPIVGSHRNKHDDPRFKFRDTEYYSAWYSTIIINLAQLQYEYNFTLNSVFSHAILFPWEAESFYGTRGFLTPLFLQASERESGKALEIETEIPEDMPLSPCDAVVGKPIFSAAQLMDKIPDGANLLHISGEGTAFSDGRLNSLAFDCGNKGIKILLTNHDEINLLGFRRKINLRIDVFEDLGMVDGKELNITEYRIDKNHNNAFRLWESMDSPQYLSKEQVSQLEQESLLSSTNRYIEKIDNGEISLKLDLMKNSVVLLELKDS